MKRNKMMRTVKLEQMFNMLHYAASTAEDCLQTISSLGDMLMYENPTLDQSIAVTNMQNEIEQWSDNYVKLASEMQQAESLYYNHLSDDKRMVEVIEAIPTPDRNMMPDEEEVAMLLVQIDCPEQEKETIVEIYGEHDFSIQGIVDDIKQLDDYVARLLQSLGSATFQGIWEETGRYVAELCRYDVRKAIMKVLELYR